MRFVPLVHSLFYIQSYQTLDLARHYMGKDLERGEAVSSDYQLITNHQSLSETHNTNNGDDESIMPLTYRKQSSATEPNQGIGAGVTVEGKRDDRQSGDVEEQTNATHQESDQTSQRRSSPGRSIFASTNLRPRLSAVHHHSAHHIVSLDQLSLREKLSLLTGASLWTLHALPRHHMPSITVSDGGHGVRKPLVETSLQHAHPATCFPPLCALACSWDNDLLYRIGHAISQECCYYNVSVLLGPGMNLKRHSCGGRNFEYFSEDPLLSGTLAASFVKGVQATGHVAACPKHFCVNNQETHRFVVDAIVDPRTCRELYYRGFEIVVRQAKPATMMCAYNRINGVYASEHHFLLTQLLRGEWGFDGVCMTDWGATHDRASAIKAGMDLEMPGSHGAHDRSIRTALERGTLNMEDVDACAERVLRLVQKYKSTARMSHAEVDWDEHARYARQAARDSIVLLKNEGRILPLARNTSIALIGDFARGHPRIQGMGSAQVTPYKIETVYEEIQQFTDKLVFAQGYAGDDDHPTDVNADLLNKAIDVAKQGDVVLLFIGLPEIMEAEGMDREHMRLPAQHVALLNEILLVHSNVVVVLTNGGIVELPDCCENASAIVEGYLLGQSGGGAICDILFGEQSPCGKLAETMPLCQSDLPCDKYFPGDRHAVTHFEGLDVGYRYFNSVGKRVRFPFGHGLSYTTFTFSDLQIMIERDEAREKLVHVSLELKNSGAMTGKEVVQLYVRQLEASVYRPFHELRAYTKVSLRPGETKLVRFSLDRDAFAFWDIGRDDWVVEDGEFEIQIGSSSQSISLKQTITFKTGRIASATAKQSYPPAASSCSDLVQAETFARRFGADSDSILNQLVARAATNRFDRNSLLKETALVSMIGRLFVHIVYTEASREIKPGPSEHRQKKMIRANVESLPLRVLVLFSKGGLSFTLLDAIIAIMNGHYLLALIFLVYSSLYAVADTVLDLCGRRTP